MKKITYQEIENLHVQSAPDVLDGTVQDNKMVFDRLPEHIAEAYNEMYDYVNISDETIKLFNELDK